MQVGKTVVTKENIMEQLRARLAQRLTEHGLVETDDQYIKQMDVHDRLAAAYLGHDGGQEGVRDFQKSFGGALWG